MEAQEERELIARLRGGEREALGDLFERLGGAMTTLARSLLHEPAEADDVVEEALVRIHRAAAGFRGERGLRTWTLRIVANLCRDRLRRRRFTAPLPEGPEALENAGLRCEPVDEWDAALDAPRELAALEAALARLPAEQREVVVMRYRLELSQAEIAATLGVPEGTVKSRIGRGLQGLRRMLGREDT